MGRGPRFWGARQEGWGLCLGGPLWRERVSGGGGELGEPENPEQCRDQRYPQQHREARQAALDRAEPSGSARLARGDRGHHRLRPVRALPRARV